MFILFSYFFLMLVHSTISAKIEGEKCVSKIDGTTMGICTRIDQCPQAMKLAMRNQRPQNCGFVGNIPIACCLPTVTTPSTSNITTTPLPEGLEKFKVLGKRAKKKCFEYQSKRIFGGTFSAAKEFPHMAIVGYGDESDIQWACGGSLISYTHVLTAAHCITSRDLGPVKWVRLGDLDIKNETEDARPQEFSVTEVFVHPEYKSTSHYHDIAIMKLNQKASFNEYVRAACLHLTREIPADRTLLATGWGKVDYAGERSSHLLKVVLNYVENPVCAKSYARVSPKKLSRGIVDEWQMCAGHPDGRDTCPGDSGGPLQYPEAADYESFLKEDGGVQTFYHIVGVTSFGKACGVAGSPGVYTRVFNYLAWIEDIVWPLSEFIKYIHQ